MVSINDVLKAMDKRMHDMYIISCVRCPLRSNKTLAIWRKIRMALKVMAG
jgi:hypothetical protein